MASVPADRVRAQIEALSTTGFDVFSFATTALNTLNRAVPFTAACIATADPATELLTGAVKTGSVVGASDELWAHFEYEVPDLYDHRSVARLPSGVTSLYAETDGHPERSPRFVEHLRPTFGFTDELRAAVRVDGTTWGFFTLYREDDRTPFTTLEHQFIAGVGAAFATGLRAGLLVGLATAPLTAVDGPAVLVIDRNGEVAQASIGAAARLADLDGDATAHDELPLALRSLIGSARQFAAGHSPLVPRMRLRTRSGQWMVAHASPLVARDGGSTDVVVTIEEARPPEIVPLVVAAFGLTSRERDVVQLVLQGIDTAEISRTLHLSTYTVQDHLKSVFGKVGVRSRRELIARVFYDQYAPRIGAGSALAPSGWFAEPV